VWACVYDLTKGTSGAQQVQEENWQETIFYMPTYILVFCTKNWQSQKCVCHIMLCTVYHFLLLYKKIHLMLCIVQLLLLESRIMSPYFIKNSSRKESLVNLTRIVLVFLFLGAKFTGSKFRDYDEKLEKAKGLVQSWRNCEDEKLSKFHSRVICVFLPKLLEL